MLEDKLPQLIRLTYNIKVLVVASYKAKQSLAAKGLTPAIFLDKFYRERTQTTNQVSFRFKEKQMRPLPQYTAVDADDYTLLRRMNKDAPEDIDEEILNKKILESLNHEQLKYIRETDKSAFEDKAKVEKFLNNQSFHWFQNCNKTFYYALSLGQDNYRCNTTDQPMGVCYIIQVQKQKTVKQIFEKVRNEKDLLMRQLYQLNPDQHKNVKPMMIILFDVSQQCTIQQALQYTAYAKQNAQIHSSLIFRLAINGEDMCDSIEWSRFNRPIIHFNYNLKSSDPVRIIAVEQFNRVQEVISYHKETIRRAFENRLEELAKKHEEVNKTTKLIASFFKGNTPSDRTYTKQQLDLRQLADKMLILEDYKRAYEVYKSLAKKMQKRNASIETNLSEMIQLCFAMSKFHNIKLKSDPYNEIQKYSDRIIKFYLNRSKFKLQRYLIFLVYVFHTFKSFDHEFITRIFYPNLKTTFSNSNPLANAVSILVYQQYANMNLLYPNIDYRRYCFDLTKVASRFSQSRMYSYAQRCFLVVESLYRDSFPNIQKYGQTQLSHILVENKNFKESLRCLKTAWEIYVTRMQNQNLQKNDQQLVKHVQNYNKVIRQIEKYAPNQLRQLVYPNLEIPKIQALNLQTKDQMLEFDEKSGTKWQDIGEIILDNKELLSTGLSQRDFRNIFKTFDLGIPQQKYLIHRFNSNNISQFVLKKNSRSAYVGEPIKLSFYMRNPLRGDIDVNEIKIKLKEKFRSVKIETNSNNANIKSFKNHQITFILTPTQPGFLQIQRIQWIFMKLLTQYHIKQPQQMKSDAKICYFKLNIHPSVGCLEASAYFQDYYYEGQKTKMKIKFKNIGTQKVTKIYIASDEFEMFGFKLNELNVEIQPKSQQQFEFDISIPLVHSTIQSGEQKKITKLLILYKTDDKYRICRTLNKFNILRIARIDNILCERLSTHLHLLSFSKRKNPNKEDASALEWMIIPGGFQIVKQQAVDLSSQRNYFFFMRKGNYPMTKLQFESWAKDINSYPKQFLHLEHPQDTNALSIRFLWRKQQKIGYISKLNIPVTINQHGYLSTVFPINFRINYEKEMKHNFMKNPYLQIPIEIKLKNVLCNEELNLTIYFLDAADSDSCWQGITEQKITLRMGAQQKIQIKYIVIRPGIYNLSNQIKYIINNSKSQVIAITHSEYEQLYLTIKNDHVDTKVDFEDAFKQFAETTVDKSMTKQSQNQSLI